MIGPSALGLLIAVAPDRTAALLDALRELGMLVAVEVGELVEWPVRRSLGR